MVDTSVWSNNFLVNQTLVFTKEGGGGRFHTDVSVSLWLAADIWFSFGLLTMRTSRCLVKCENPETYSLLCEDRPQ